MKTLVFSLAIVACVSTSALATKLADVRAVDEQYLMVYYQDGIIEYQDDGKGETAFMGAESGGSDTLKTFGQPLDIASASNAASYTLTSSDDSNYSAATPAAAASRKTKVNGTTRQWPEPPCALEHTIFLKLPEKLQQGKHYRLGIASATNSDTLTRDFVFDIFSNVSEAIHVNLIGYNPDHTLIKSGDLYMWLGDGGARDYSSYAGRKVTLYNVATGEKTPVGAVSFWKSSGKDYGGWNATESDVWNCDFSSFTGTGTYRLAIDGIGCSPDFRLSRDIYYEPFKTSVRGFFYMRIGMGKEFTPVPRQPRFIPDKDPVGFKVYMTSYGPFHPDWAKGRGDQWDNRDWSKYNEPGNPTNPNAWGGHSDACDWDRNPSHVSIIWDMLLPYLLSNGKLSDDNLNIAESGNGVPDIIDEARYEVDFWLRLRDGNGGYGSGLNNPSDDKSTMYQGAASPFMAWASAANCAMLADCYRIAGKPDLMNQYRDAAIEAWKVANDEGLDLRHGIGNSAMRGRDLKMMAAAFLYNVTGDRAYEDAMAEYSVATTPTSEIDVYDKYCQFWGTAAYLMCAKQNWQPIHHQDLLENMKASILNEAKLKNTANMDKWPSRRCSDNAYGYWQSRQEVQRVCIAHAIATEQADKDLMLKAMILEADYGLGRNPLNMVQMTGLGSRCVENIFTTGRNDGVPGLHPGHTPYMGADPWGKAFNSNPQWYASRGYPDWAKWPHGEALWNVRYCYANNEFTPQQTMRGKMCLLGYLYALGETHVTR